MASIEFNYPNFFLVYLKRYKPNEETKSFVKKCKKSLGLTQENLSFKAGVGLKFVRDLEQGKQSLQKDKVNQVLSLFGHELGQLNQKEMKKAKVYIHDKIAGILSEDENGFHFYV